MTKTEFASHMGVSRFAVSKWIERGTLSDAALEGTGRKARIRVPVAIDEIRRNRDIGQSLGNGIATRTSQGSRDLAAAATPPTPKSAEPNEDRRDEPNTAPDVPAPVPLVDSVEAQLKRARLEEQLRRNRLQAADEAKLQGELLSAKDARTQMARIAGTMLQIFEGALPDFASKVAEKFDVPQRDVLHLMRDHFRTVRSEAARKEQARAEATPIEAKARLGEVD
ncbi:hypothetical protein FEV53_13530 [Palleronia caenipelagi]|uniref:Uncharacterized protein n=2 Tax=Palleronia caenipelagi TaxID=2489174 RepID=A0A547PS25_9RHOB|nr:hypothetical protein FEV53_13530 [Palleronia caenipelagi]